MTTASVCQGFEAALVAKGWTNEILAENSSVSKERIIEIRKPGSVATEDEYQKIVKALGVITPPHSIKAT